MFIIIVYYYGFYYYLLPVKMVNSPTENGILLFNIYVRFLGQPPSAITGKSKRSLVASQSAVRNSKVQVQCSIVSAGCAILYSLYMSNDVNCKWQMPI